MSLQGYFATIFRSIKIGLPEKAVEDILFRHQVESWFLKSAFRKRRERWFVWKPSLWLARRLRPEASILETACGCAFNLIWFGQYGFSHLYGFDNDPKALAAAAELCNLTKIPVKLWYDDGLNPSHIPPKRFDAILAFSWVYHLENFNLYNFFKTYSKFLTPQGYIVVDLVDISYNRLPNNQYLSSDWGKPEEQRAPSEYKKRYAKEEVIETINALGLKVIKILFHRTIIPRRIYIVSL